jgi:hypothetical protein
VHRKRGAAGGASNPGCIRVVVVLGTRRPTAIGGTPGRIVVMQVATIIGGMFARTYGDTAPWLILIGLKTLFDYQRPDRRLAAHR